MKKYFYSRALFDTMIVKHTTISIIWKIRSFYTDNTHRDATSFIFMDMSKQL